MIFSFFTRPRIISIGILLFSLLLIGKLFSVQVLNSKVYAESAERQYATPSGDIFERGTIFFKNKKGELIRAATQVTGYKVAIVPAKLLDAEQAYSKLSTIIEVDHDSFMARADKKDDPYEEIAKSLTKEQADKISAMSIEGVSIFKEKWRFYPGNSMASHALGFVGYKGDELGGRYGLERQYNKTLSQEGGTPYVNFFAEVFSNISSSLFSGDEKNGDIVTTIDPEVQSFLEKTLRGVKEAHSVQSIGGIIMNPTNGEIYAISSMPDFDPNNFSDTKSLRTFANPWVENVLEFGSVVKPLVMAAGLDAKVVTPQTSYTDTGVVTVEKKQIYNFDKKGRGPNTTMQDVLGQSLNTGMVYVFEKLGKDRLRDYLYGYGIKEKTGIDLPNETTSLTRNLESPRQLEYANASFGQGIALTPIVLVRALSSLANGGTLPTPHLVSEVRYDDGSVNKLKYENEPTKISKETSEEITRMLVGVMDKSLANGKLKLEHYSIAVKTGTAQVANPSGGGYYEDKHTHSFFGYLPAYDPKFIVLLYAIDPRGVRYASETWTSPFMEIAQFLLNYYEVPPDR